LSCRSIQKYPFFYKLQHTAKHRFNTLKLRNGTKICLNVEDEDTVEQAAMTDAMETVTHMTALGGFADKSSRLKGMKEHRLRFKRLEVPVAPVAFRLETILGVVLFYWFMLFYVVLCCFMLFYVVLCCFVLFYVVLCCFMLFYVVLCCFVLFYVVLCCFMLFYVVLCCFMLFYVVLFLRYS